MSRFGLAVDLVDAMSIQFKGQAVGSVGGTANAGSAYNVHLSIYCENGALHFDSLAQYAAIHKTGETPEKLPTSLQSEQPYVVTRNFINLILGREERRSPEENHSPEESRSPGETGWRTVELLEAAYRSAAEDGRPVKVEELYSD
jgi:predicted dehydrogenase